MFHLKRYKYRREFFKMLVHQLWNTKRTNKRIVLQNRHERWNKLKTYLFLLIDRADNDYQMNIVHSFCWKKKVFNLFNFQLYEKNVKILVQHVTCLNGNYWRYYDKKMWLNWKHSTLNYYWHDQPQDESHHRFRLLQFS